MLDFWQSMITNFSEMSILINHLMNLLSTYLKNILDYLILWLIFLSNLLEDGYLWCNTQNNVENILDIIDICDINKIEYDAYIEKEDDLAEEDINTNKYNKLFYLIGIISVTLISAYAIYYFDLLSLIHTLPTNDVPNNINDTIENSK